MATMRITLRWVCSGSASADPLLFLTRAQALQDPGMPSDGADHDGTRGDVGAGEDDRFAQLGAVADPHAVPEHQRPHQAHARANVDVVTDPRLTVYLQILRQRLLTGKDNPR